MKETYVHIERNEMVALDSHGIYVILKSLVMLH